MTEEGSAESTCGNRAEDEGAIQTLSGGPPSRVIGSASLRPARYWLVPRGQPVDIAVDIALCPVHIVCKHLFDARYRIRHDHLAMSGASAPRVPEVEAFSE